MSKGLVLLADDDEGPRSTHAEILERHGFEVETFETANSLLARFKELSQQHSKPVAIVSDNNIRNSISGTQLAKEIRLLDPSLPFLLVSSINVGAEITVPLEISFMKKKGIYDGSRPKGERNLIGIKLDDMIQKVAAIGSGQLEP